VLPLREQRKRGLGENHQSPDQIPLNQQAVTLAALIGRF